MKTVFCLFAFLLTSPAFAAVQVICESEDGSAFQGIISEDNRIYQVRARIREGRFQEIPHAQVTHVKTAHIQGTEVLTSALIRTGRGHFVASVQNGVYTDAMGGRYEITRCEVSY